MTTWKGLLQGEMDYQDDAGPVVAYLPEESAFDVEATRDGAVELVAWTEHRVYFLDIGDEIGERAFVSGLRNPPRPTPKEPR